MRVSTKPLLKNPNYIAIDGRKRSTYDIAVASGASQDLVDREGWFLKDELEDITYINAKGKTRIQSVNQQMDDWLRVWQDPFEHPYNYVITSNPNDTKAQMAAMRLFLRAYVLNQEKTRKSKVIWHQIYGGYSRDKLRDQEKDGSISFLVLSNIPDFATAYKLEKVRDIISKYNSIPKILITTGGMPTDVGKQLRVSVNYALHLSKDGKSSKSNKGTKYSNSRAQPKRF